MKKLFLLTAMLFALVFTSCEKVDTPTPSAKFTVTLTVDNQTSEPVTFNCAVGEGYDSCSYEGVTTPDVTFPVGVSTKTFTSDMNVGNVWFMWMLNTMDKQVYRLDENGVLKFWGYGLTYTMVDKYDIVMLTVKNKNANP